MIRIGGDDLKSVPAHGVKLVLSLHTADSFVVDTDPLTTKLLAEAPITVARKLSLYPLDMIAQLGVTAGLSVSVALGLVVITARCQGHDFDPLDNRGKLSAVITDVLTLLRRRSQSPSFFR